MTQMASIDGGRAPAFWDLERIRSHFASDFPLAALLGIEAIDANPSHVRFRLVATPTMFRPGGMVAGPVLFALADMTTYALTLVQRPDAQSATSSLLINFLRPAPRFPLVSEAVTLRAGRNLITYDVRIWPEAEGPERLVAQATATWALAADTRAKVPVIHENGGLR